MKKKAGQGFWLTSFFPVELPGTNEAQKSR